MSFSVNYVVLVTNGCSSLTTVLSLAREGNMKKYNRSLKLYVVVALSKFNMNKPNYKKKFNSFTAEKHSKSLRSSLCGGAGSLSPINITQCICRRTGSPFRLTNSFPLLGLCQVVNICFLWFLIGFYYAQPKVSCLIYL